MNNQKLYMLKADTKEEGQLWFKELEIVIQEASQ